MATCKSKVKSDEFYKYTKKIIDNLCVDAFGNELLSLLKVKDISIRYYNTDVFAYTIIIVITINNIVITSEYEGSVNSDYISRITYKVIDYNYNDTIIPIPIKGGKRFYDHDELVAESCYTFDDENIDDKINNDSLKLAYVANQFKNTSFEELRDFLINVYSFINLELFLDIADDKNIFGIHVTNI
jgi:hypothetical protein